MFCCPPAGHSVQASDPSHPIVIRLGHNGRKSAYIQKRYEGLGVRLVGKLDGGSSPGRQHYIEPFHRSLKEEEVWTAEYRSLEEARTSIGCWTEEYNHDRPHRGVQNRTPHEAFLAFAIDLKNEALTV